MNGRPRTTALRRWFLYSKGAGGQLFGPGDFIFGHEGWAPLEHNEWRLIAYWDRKPTQVDVENATWKARART